MQRHERGSATLEFALVLPLLLIITLALVQVGLLVRDQMVLVEAARAGAREASVTSDDSAVNEAVQRAATGLESDRLEIEIRRDAGGQGTPVSVHLHYRDWIRISMVRWLFPETVSLRAEATMRREYP